MLNKQESLTNVKKNKNVKVVTYIENRHLVQQHKYSETTST